MAESDDFNLVFYPKAFQIAGETFDERYHFVGPCFGDSTFSGQWQPPASGRPVVLMVISSLYGIEPDFLRSCVRAFGNSPWHAVIALGPAMEAMELEELGPLPSNVEVHRWISLPAVLEHARVLLGPANAGGSMLSLYSGVPLVVLPQASDGELIAGQITALGLGRAFSAGEVTAESLVDSLLEVAEDEEIRHRVLWMQREIRAAGGTIRAVDEIEKYLSTVR